LIPAAAFDFLRRLAANNEKAWFEANRATYESAVRNPVAALVASVTAELTKRSVPLEGDTRFSNDKSPYKTSVGVVWFRQGHSKGSPGVLYFHLDPAGCFVAAAFWHPEPDVLDSIRERIRVRPDRYAAMLAALSEAGLALEEGERLSRMPKGFEDLKGTAIDPALRLKNFIVRRPLSGEVVERKALAPKIAEFGAQALPLLRFGWDAVDEISSASPLGQGS